MQNIQLYIEGQRLEMFKDESISITQSIQNVKDIAKVFTDFTKTFAVPASKNNNKIFKHYYNFDIVSGFDARTKKKANIELNSLPFKNGKIRLEGVDLKNNVPHTYRVTFFGSTVELKDLIGEDTLSSLSDLSAFNTVYSPGNIRTALQANPTSIDLIAPLITHTKRLIYNSASTTADEGNLAYNESYNRGVEWSDLKYAIRLHRVILAIQSKYSITFSTDFFNTSNAPYHSLFLWLHRKKGSVESPSGLNESFVNGWSNDSDSETFTSMTSDVLSVQTTDLIFELRFTTLSGTLYSVSIQRNGIEVHNSGTKTGEFVIDNSDFNFSAGDYSVYISSTADINFSNIRWFIKLEEDDGSSFTKIYDTLSYDYLNLFKFNITQQIPDMKVIDFLTSIFKTFNLTAFVDKNTDVIVVKTLDNFYSSGATFDITKNIDVNSSSVNVALPFRKINFGYEDTGTLLATVHEQLFGQPWGEIEYTNDERLDGSIYNVKPSFAHLKYERLVNLAVGYYVDENQDSYLGKPLLFYPIRRSFLTPLSFITDSTTHQSLQTYNVPSNSLSLVAAGSKVNINFSNEVNEYALTDSNGFTDTLFEVYYKKYIQSVFNKSNRLTKVTAYLPLSILLNYTLADTFIINGSKYKINSITTNLENGKSQLELLNDL
jgi:hypothetical protein